MWSMDMSSVTQPTDIVESSARLPIDSITSGVPGCIRLLIPATPTDHSSYALLGVLSVCLEGEMLA